jgi:hypothetical protein
MLPVCTHPNPLPTQGEGIRKKEEENEKPELSSLIKVLTGA